MDIGRGAGEAEGRVPETAVVEELRTSKLSHRLANRMRAQIYSGQLRPGSRLPGEAELSAMYRVSRPTIREALRIVEAEGLIELGRGMRSGAIVLAPNVSKVIEYASFLLATKDVTLSDLHAARSFFEPEIIRSLDTARLQVALTSLQRIVADMEGALRARRYFDVVTGSKHFHSVLAAAAPNPLIALIVGIFQNISDDAYAAALMERRSAPTNQFVKNIQKTCAAYNTACKLLAAGDSQAAAAFWREYMDRANRFLMQTELGRRRLMLFTQANEYHDPAASPILLSGK